jgi:hypothetical protein
MFTDKLVASSIAIIFFGGKLTSPLCVLAGVLLA